MAASLHADRRFRRWQWRVFGVAWLTYASFYLCRVNLAVALPAIRADLSWDSRAAGLIGSAFLWVYALGQLVNGALGQRANARWFVGTGMLVSALCNVAFGSTSVLPLMVVVWALNGWAQSMGWGPIIKTISAWFDARRRGRIAALFSPCFVLGHLTAWAAGGWLVGMFGWRYAFWLPAAVFGTMAVVWIVGIRTTPQAAGFRAIGERVDSPPAGLGRILGSLLAQPRLRWAALICLLTSMIKDGLTLWTPTMLVDAWGMPVERAALAASVVPLVGLTGSLLAGWASDRYFRSHEMPGVIGLSLALGTAMTGFLLLPSGNSPWVAVLFLGLSGMAAYGINSLLLTSLPLSFDAPGAVAGFLDFASYVGGGISALVVGQLLTRQSWNAVYTYWLAATLLAALCAAASQRRIRSQMP
jgi:OPA family glycerol-3-phosphate transporter-like MFS transporter